MRNARVCAMLCTGGNGHREISHRHLLLRVGKRFEVRADIDLGHRPVGVDCSGSSFMGTVMGLNVFA